MSESKPLGSTKKSRSVQVFILSLVLMMLCSLFNWGIMTGWGDVRIERLTLIGDNGLRYSAVMYTPKEATDENPAPGVVFFHGNSGNAHSHEMQAIEYARRGFVCISADNNGGGDSEFSKADGNTVVAELFTKYFMDLPIVDLDRLVFAGHSMGGDMAVQMAIKYQPTALLVSDNGGMGEELGATYGDVLYINGGADKLNPADVYRERATNRFVMDGVDMQGDEVAVPGKLYGSFEDGNASMLVEIPGQVHEAAIVNSDHLAAMLDFTQQCFDVPDPIDPNDQIWQWSSVFGQLGMFAFVFFLCSLAVLIIDKVPFFAYVRQPMPRNIGMRRFPLAISIIAAIGFPVLTLYTGCLGLLDAVGGRNPNTELFQVKYTNFAMCIVLVLNLFGLVMFFVYHFTEGRKHSPKLCDYGLTAAGKNKFDFKLIGKSALLALIVVIVGWTYLAAQQDLLGTEFFCLYWGYRPVLAEKLIYYIPYVIVWCFAFAIAALGMCVERRLPSTGKDWLDTVIAVVFNAILATFAISACVLIENSLQMAAGTNPNAMSGWGVDMTRIWGMPIGMLIGGGGNTYCYRKTGNIWLGAFLMGTVCALSACLYGQIAFA